VAFTGHRDAPAGGGKLGCSPSPCAIGGRAEVVLARVVAAVFNVGVVMAEVVLAEVVLARVVAAVFNVGVVMAEVVMAEVVMAEVVLARVVAAVFNVGVVMAEVVLAVDARGTKQRVGFSRGAEWHRRHPPPAGRPRTRPQAPREPDPKPQQVRGPRNHRDVIITLSGWCLKLTPGF